MMIWIVTMYKIGLLGVTTERSAWTYDEKRCGY